ncbi:phosphoglycerate dehydrogenase-like enzyme [Rhizobium sp. SJZ105]|nr:phosphoglycerate dehydrogenase-like enzyme [Rhizobium sp. SJZ105]
MKDQKNVIIWHERPDWTASYVSRLEEVLPDLRYIGVASHGEAMKVAPLANVMIGIAPYLKPELITAMPRLEWIQSLTTGIDNLLQMAELPKGLPITRIAGVQGPQMSEHVLTLMLCLARDIPGVLKRQRAHDWDRRPQKALHGKTVCILGLGKIAEYLARYCRVLGMRVTAISDGRQCAENVDEIFPRSRIGDAVAEADFLVVLVPLTPATRHIVNESVLSRMKANAFVINVARGGCVDEAALHAALSSGRIAGAALDVFETEPLPSGNPLWDLPNVIVTPHVGGFADIYLEQCFPIVHENLKAYAGGGSEAVKDAERR